jgi:hypothetical protein
MSYYNKYERGSPPVLAGYLIFFLITSSFEFWKLFVIKEPLVNVSSKSLKEPRVFL